MVLRRQYRQLREELAKLPVPEGLEDLVQPFSANVPSPTPTSSQQDIVSTEQDELSSASSPSSYYNQEATTSMNYESNHVGESDINLNLPDIDIDPNDPLIISIKDDL